MPTSFSGRLSYLSSNKLDNDFNDHTLNNIQKQFALYRFACSGCQSNAPIIHEEFKKIASNRLSAPIHISWLLLSKSLESESIKDTGQYVGSPSLCVAYLNLLGNSSFNEKIKNNITQHLAIYWLGVFSHIDKLSVFEPGSAEAYTAKILKSNLINAVELLITDLESKSIFDNINVSDPFFKEKSYQAGKVVICELVKLNNHIAFNKSENMHDKKLG